MVDINGDGLLDIYTTAITGFANLEGRNELFINNGDSTFTENGREYGLDIEGFSNHAAFFDYDHDGDLDCYILNISLRTAHRRVPKAKTRHQVDGNAGDLLLQNNGKQFVDVSQKAGIHQGPTGFGLGLAIADFNNDNWEDIYISNDFFEDDYLYINNRDGTFTESGKQYFKHFSRASMGNDAADYNNDGFIDLVTLDMFPADEYTEKTTLGEEPLRVKKQKNKLGYYHQVGKNAFQLNNAGKSFSDLAPLLGVEATDWSWAPLMADYNLDGIKDLYVTNGIPKRANSLSYIKFYQEAAKKIKKDFDIEAFYEETINQMPDGKSFDYLFEGTKNLIFNNKAHEWGIEEKSYTNGAAYADLDNDGDLDIITNRLFDSPIIYKNKAREQENNSYLKIRLHGNKENSYGIGAKVYVYENGEMQLIQNMPSRGFLSSVDPLLNFGFNSISAKIDSVRVVWDHEYQQTLTNVDTNRTIIVHKQDAELLKKSNAKQYDKYFTEEEIINHKHQENDFNDFSREPLMPFKASQEGPALAIGDVDNNGLKDIFIGGAKLQPSALWVQQANGVFKQSSQEIFKKHKVFEDVDALFFDANGDGLKDLYVVSGGNEFYGKMEEQSDRLYINIGNGNFQYAPQRLPDMFENKSVVTASDVDEDGDKDLFVGGRVVAYSYGKIPNSYLLINDGNGFFEDKTEQYGGDLKQIGMVTDAAWGDINGDSKQDLVVVGEFMPIMVYINTDASLERLEIKDFETGKTTSGLWQSVKLHDINQDGRIDILAGNLGMNNVFNKPNGKGRLKMYVNDFVDTGITHQLLTYDRDGKWYPAYTFKELKSVLPSLLSGISDHTQFAGRSVSELISASNLSDAEIRKAELLSSVLIKNNGDRNFNIEPLPVEAQVAPIFDFFISDFNEDKVPDIVAGGNKYGVSRYQTRYDASIGTLIFGERDGNLKTINTELVGIPLNGEVRNIEGTTINGNNYIIVAQNDGKIKFYKRSMDNNELNKILDSSATSMSTQRVVSNSN